MSLLDGSTELISIKLYYKYANTKVGKRLVILEEDKAIELLKDEKKAKEVEILETGWSMITWKEQNEIMELSYKKTNPQTMEKQFDFISYRDAIVKRCLKTWDISVNNQIVPVTSEAIDQLPGIVVINIYQKFEEFLDYSEEELKN